MKAKSLYQTNPYLKNKTKARKLIVRSIASSTAIETGESIVKIEEKLSQQHVRVTRVKLA